MVLPAFADLAELEDRLAVSFSASEAAQAQAALDDASSLIRACAGVSWVVDDEIDFGDLADWRQREIVRITLAVARRVLENPQGFTEMHFADAGASFANASPDAYLTAAEKAAIRSMVATSVVPGLASIRVVAPAAASGSRWGCDIDQLIESDAGSGS